MKPSFDFLFCLATGTMTFVPLTADAADRDKADKRPNIIHIMTDDHSFQTISAYGHPISQLAKTPNIDRLAEEGMIFRKAYVENSLSTPSRACLMTGLYSHQNGQLQLEEGIDTTKTFFSEILSDAGYTTAVIGKWHMECEPKGFQHFCVLNDQGPYYNPDFKTEDSEGRYIREEGYTTDLITDHAIEFMENADREKPFCLLVHHKAPHREWMPDVKYRNLYNDIEFPTPSTFYDDYTSRGQAARTQTMTIYEDMNLNSDLKVGQLDGWGVMWRLTPEQREPLIEAFSEQNRPYLEGNLEGKELAEWMFQRYLRDYLRCIRSVDDSVGAILDYLDENGLSENTIVVYTSDQGFYMGEHGWYDKRFMYEESFRTPLLIRYPGHIAPGSECTELVQNIDYAPTYIDLAGAKKDKEMVGRSLAPLFDGKQKNWRDYLYYHYYDYPAWHMVSRQDGVTDGRYKLIHFYPTDEEPDETNCYYEMYDLLCDPLETNNIYGRTGYEEVAERLEKQLFRFRKEYKVTEY